MIHDEIIQIHKDNYNQNAENQIESKIQIYKDQKKKYTEFIE